MIFLDYDGTLVPFTNEPRGSAPGPALLNTLRNLTGNNANRVIIISGRDKETLFDWLGHFNIEFACEHGAWIKERDKPWISQVGNSGDWKRAVRHIFEVFVNRVPGAVIEEKDHSLVWHYRNVPESAGNAFVDELLAELARVADLDQVEIFRNDMALEVKNSKVNKGIAANQWVKKYQPEFILAIGDDRTDEDTFKAIPETALTIKVRSGPSAARYFLPSHSDVLELLDRLHA